MDGSPEQLAVLASEPLDDRARTRNTTQMVLPWRADPGRRGRFSSTQVIALLVPPVLTATMYLAFTALVAALGFERGYLAAFAIYWVGWCLLVPLALLGPQKLFALFEDGSPRFGSRQCLTLGLLLWPLPVAFVFAFLPRIGDVGVTVFVASLVVGVIIGVTEEVLWRGLYVELFPENPWLGLLYPAVWFGLWHLAPQAVLTSDFTGAPYSFVLYAILLGLSYGYYSWVTGSIRCGTVSHVVQDSLGLAGGTFLAGMGLLL